MHNLFAVWPEFFGHVASIRVPRVTSNTTDINAQYFCCLAGISAMLLTHLVLWNRIAVHELPLLVALSNLSVIQEYRDTSVILFLFFFSF